MSRGSTRASTSKFNLSSITHAVNYTSSSCLVTPSKPRLKKYIPLSKQPSRELHKTHILSRDNLSYSSKPKDENLLERSLIVKKQPQESKFTYSRSDISSASDSVHLPQINIKDKCSHQFSDIQHRYHKRMLPIDNILLPRYKAILEKSDNFLSKLYESHECLNTPKSAIHSKRFDFSGKICEEDLNLKSFSRDTSPSAIRSISITTRNKRKAKEFSYDLITIQPFESNSHPRSVSMPRKSVKEASHTETQTDIDTDPEEGQLNIDLSNNYCISEDDSAEEESPTVRYKSRYNVFK